MATQIIIADDHPLFRGALRQAVERVWPEAEIVESSTATNARKTASESPADLLLLDLHMDDSRGLTALLEFRQDFPAMPVIVVSASEEPRVWQAAKLLGASAFIPKSADFAAMQEALLAVINGDVWFPSGNVADDTEDLAIFEKLASLTPAQRRILGYVGQGMLNKQIAYEMDITVATVKAHITAMFRKLDVINRTQAVLAAGKLDIEQPATETAVADQDALHSQGKI